MRPIDADVLEKHLNIRVANLRKEYGDYDAYTDGVEDAVTAVELSTTLTLDDLRSNGEWVKNGWNDYSCSKCETQYVGHGASAWNYCPNCGHPMKGGGK